MKKVLLVAVIALVTLSASAVNRSRVQKANLVSEKKVQLTTVKDFKSIEAMFKAQSTGRKANKIANVSASRRAGDIQDQLVPAYSEYGYYQSIIGFLQRNMYDGASYLVDGEKAYLAPFENLGYVEGVLDATAENPFAEYGAVVYKFTSGVIATYDDKVNPAVELSLEPCAQDRNTYRAYRTGETTFYAYYIAEYDEFYFPDILALFDANSAETEVFDDYYLVADLDLQPQELRNKYTVKGTFTGADLDGPEYDVSGDCQIYLGYSAYFVKGANGSGEDTWVEYAIDKSDESILTVESFQYTGGPYGFTLSSAPDTPYYGVFLTYGFNKEGNATEDQSSTFKMSDNADMTTTIANTNNTIYGDVVLLDKDGTPTLASFAAVDLNITITWEPAYPDAGGDDPNGGDDTAIKGVKSEKVNANGTYNLNGQRVNDNAKGLIIKDGKKYIMK